MNRILKWLGTRLFPQKAESESVLRQTTRGRKPSAKPVRKKVTEPDLVDFESELGGRVDDGGHDGAAEGRADRQDRLLERGKLADQEFAFDFQTDDEEEDHHQSVGNPVAQ